MRVQHHDLQRAADAAQIDQSVVVFLEAMKISNLGMLAAAADSFAEVDEQFWQKWCDGIISEEGKELKLTDDNEMTAWAALRYLWKEASSSWPQDGHEFADPPSWQRNEGPKQSSPKEMSPEIFQTLVEKYESTTVDGRQRSFPMRLLLGAEKVVNRVWVEHHVTRQYTPLQLHEILRVQMFRQQWPTQQSRAHVQDQVTSPEADARQRHACCRHGGRTIMVSKRPPQHLGCNRSHPILLDTDPPCTRAGHPQLHEMVVSTF